MQGQEELCSTQSTQEWCSVRFQIRQQRGTSAQRNSNGLFSHYQRGVTSSSDLREIQIQEKWLLLQRTLRPGQNGWNKSQSPSWTVAFSLRLAQMPTSCRQLYLGHQWMPPVAERTRTSGMNEPCVADPLFICSLLLPLMMAVDRVKWNFWFDSVKCWAEHHHIKECLSKITMPIYQVRLGDLIWGGVATSHRLLWRHPFHSVSGGDGEWLSC